MNPIRTAFGIRSVAVEDAVPPGRMGYGLRAEYLLLHTIQTVEAVDVLATTGVLRPPPATVCQEWPDAYAWMVRKMSERMNEHISESPVWLWARIRRDELIRNMRRSRGQILLTCRIPRERVLLSQFDEWHSVLNCWLSVVPFVGEAETEYEARLEELTEDFLTRVEAAGMRNAPLDQWPLSLRQEMEGSWDAIFDIDRFDRYAYWQATVHELRDSDVIDAVWIELP